jgi:NTE family protein
MNVALVLSGGGARGAYQVGALQALSEIVRGKGHSRPLPFSILAGASAGAITSAFLAARADDFTFAVQRLVHFWGNIQPHDVFRTDVPTLARVCAEWLVDLSFGGLVGRHREKALLVSDPLRRVLENRLDMAAVHENVERGMLRGVALTATDYRTSLGVTFFDGAPDVEPWTRSTRYGVRDRLAIDHVMASAAIPIFFPAVRVGDGYYADGCLRSTSPLSPAIHLGADRILAIGTRCPAAAARERPKESAYPSIADTAGLVLNAVFVEALEADVERLERINQSLSLLPHGARDAAAMQLRSVPLFVLRPSEDLGAMAKDVLRDLPVMIQYLFRGLGVSGQSGWDLLSYLAFDQAYTSRLLALGYADAMRHAEELIAFLGSPGLGDNHVASTPHFETNGTPAGK